MKKIRLIHMLYYISYIIVVLIISGCSIVDTGYIKKGPQYPPYTGKVEVFWKGYQEPAPNTYELLGTVSAKTGELTMQPQGYGLFNKELHNYIIEQAALRGGNGVIIYCGEIGSVAQKHCYGNVIIIK